MNLRKCVYQGSAWGVLTWGVYGAGEVAFFVLRPILAGYQEIVIPAQWIVTAISLAAYLLAGATLGGLAGAAAARWSGDGAFLARRFAVMTLPIAYVSNLLTNLSYLETASHVGLAVALILLAGIFATTVRRARGGIFAIFDDPWTAVMLLLGAPLLLYPIGALRLAAFVAGSGALFIANARLLNGGKRIGGFPVRQALALSIALPITVLATWGAAGRGLEPIRSFNKTASAGSRPNILLVVMDTVRADHTSLYGYGRDTTPWLKSFAERATLYSRSFAPSNFTLPSHASMFTGLYPRSHGAAYNPPGKSMGQPLARKYQTLAETLGENGYLNLAVVSNFAYLRREFGMDQGFHSYDARQPVPCLPDEKFYYLRHGVRNILDLFVTASLFDRKVRTAEEVNKVAFSLLERAREADSPFFLFVNYMDAHFPYAPPAPYDDVFEGRNRRTTFPDYLRLKNEVMRGERAISEVERRHYISQYDGAIAYIDAHIEKLVERVRKLGMYENTMIVVTSDHGEAFGGHRNVGHGSSLYQNQVFVPLVVKYPGQRGGEKLRTLVGLVDLMPTALDAAGILSPGDLQGTSLLALKEDVAVPRSVYAEGNASAMLAAAQPDYPKSEWAVFTPDDAKLISNSNGRSELYDLAADPDEEHDLRQSHAIRSRALLGMLEEWREGLPIGLEAADASDPRTMDRLRNLGYVQ